MILSTVQETCTLMILYDQIGNWNMTISTFYY